ncbi:MAG: hypothetical protein NZM31_03520, partial [Gemmatales bacterium]|nr:hypothetical protein [Gemmatales bacterium]MDW8386068.1 hypothetical protein [Gemmatales bacterium]
QESAESAKSKPLDDTKPRELPGLHNVIRVTDKLWSGSGPETEEAFQSLKQLGIRTIISVDGARPNVEMARKYGLRYVHLPVGYDGIPAEQGRKIALAVHHLPGPIYLHCHHGRHRGPSAAAVVWRSLDRSCKAEQALSLLKKAGTDPRYAGLYAAVEQAAPLSDEVLNAKPPEFPETTPVPAFVEAMVKVDTHWHHLQACRKAGWKTPPEHPDVVPRHEALQLMEAYQEALRLPGLKERPAEIRDWLSDEVQNAKRLMELLEGMPIQPQAVEAAYLRVQDGCKRCHSRYRDVPESR